MSPNPLNVNIKYGNSEKALKSVDTNVNFLSVNQEQLITQEKLNSLKNSSGMEKMIFLSDSEITNLALDIIFGKYSDSNEIIESMDYYSD